MNEGMQINFIDIWNACTVLPPSCFLVSVTFFSKCNTTEDSAEIAIYIQTADEMK